MNTILFLSEAASYFASVHLMKKFGNRNLMIYSFILSGVSFILFYLVSSEDILIIIILLIFLAKFGASVILNVSSIYTNDSFPTFIRGRSTAVCSFLGKFGGIIAPIIVETSAFTGIVSGLSCIMAALILLPLENTSGNIELNDDVEENVGKKQESEMKVVDIVSTNKSESIE